MRLVARAPGKVNLSLLLGPRRADGYHALASVVEATSLADEVRLAPAPEGIEDDLVVCPGVDGENLAARALAAYREATGRRGPPVRLDIDKRIPVAAGMGGGSSDAAAALRLAASAAGRPLEGLGPADRAALDAVAFGLGADVPALLAPGLVAVEGAGERVRALASAPAHGILVLPSPHRLATADVFAEADRLGLARGAAELRERHERALAELADGALPAPDALVNDLQPAAAALCPSIGRALEGALAAGADHAMVSGSGPTVFGLFLGADGPRRAETAAVALAGRDPAPVACAPVDAAWAAPRPAAEEPA